MEQMELESSPLDVKDLKEEKRSRWRSIYLISFTTYLDTTSLTLTIIALWPYLKQVDPHASLTLLGFVIGAFSVGLLIGTTVFGTISGRTKSFKNLIIISLFFGIAGSIIYADIDFFPPRRGYFLILARFLLGVRAGNLTVAKAYVAWSTTNEERTKAMSLAGGFELFGMISGPALQAALVPLGYPGPVHVPGLHINMYSTAGILGCFLACTNLLLMIVFFKEHHIEDTVDSNNKAQSTDEENKSQLKPDYLAVVTCIILYFLVQVIYITTETLVGPFTMLMFNWNGQQASLYNGIAFAGCALLSVICCIILSQLSSRISDRMILLVGLITLTFVGISLWPYSSVPVDIHQPLKNGYNSTLHNVTRPVTTCTIHSTCTRIVGQHTNAHGGCSPEHSWCKTMTKTYIGQFVLSIIFSGIGQALCFVATWAVFSKILGPRSQGAFMSLMESSRSIACLSGTLLSGYIFDLYGPKAVLVMLIASPALGLFLIIIMFRRFIPYADRQHEERIRLVQDKAKN